MFCFQIHWVLRLQQSVTTIVRQHNALIRHGVVIFCLLGYFVYLGFAIHYSIVLAEPLIIITAAVLLILLYIFIRDNYGEVIYHRACMPASRWIDRQWYWIKWWVPGSQ